MSARPEHIRESLARTRLLVQRDVFPALAAEQIIEHLAGGRICVRADERNVDTPAGQSAATAAVVALAQLGMQLALDIPNVELRDAQPPLRADLPLAGALRDLCEHLIQPADLEPDAPVDLTVLLGDTAARQDATATLRVHGSAWEAAVEIDPGTPAPRWTGDLPFGAFLGAQAAAAECFRSSMAALGRRFGIDPLPEHRIGSPGPVRLALEPVELSGRLDIGAVDMISAGAITNAALAVLLRVPGLHGSLRVVDDDTGAASNLNRYALLRTEWLGVSKVEVLARLGTPALAIEPGARRLAAASMPAMGPLAARVLVGVDDIPSRWIAQAHAPDWLCVAGTSRMEIVVSEHVPEGPCAGCMHPHDDAGGGEIPTVSFVSQLAGVLQAHRLLHHVAEGHALPAVVAYGLGLGAPRPLMGLGQVSRSDCPVGCAASRSATT